MAGGLRNRSTDGDGGVRKRERRSNGESIGWNTKKIKEMHRKRKIGRREGGSERKKEKFKNERRRWRE